MANDSDQARLLPEVAGVNDDLLNPAGLVATPMGAQRLAARAAVVNAITKFSIPDLIKMASNGQADPEFRLRVHATLLKYGLGEELTVKVGNELLFQLFVRETAPEFQDHQNWSPERQEEWMGRLYQALRGVA